MKTKEEIILMAIRPQKGPCFGFSDTNGPPSEKKPPENIVFAHTLVDKLRSNPLEPHQKDSEE
ncbi:MAG: hypothetical protein KBC62_00230 [Candidatus Pacebacteria bacterium]|nr:hypothetical protein [Candidatus Paceibacterota bacterium]MBP9842413.1 hypothetical protein [Candidatus Paceibacterota bacterium]